uniref:Nuclease harbi1-like protein n=1 Tax=Rhipicephalus zambeziensis TaxID=60191 RepID=A0A224YV12_9ACAR
MNCIADRFDVTESSVVLCLRRVLDFLLDISAEVIAWPNDAQMNRSKARFLAKSDGKGPRNTVGCIDGSHIEIARPEESTASYFNRKKWPSIILQGICNEDNRFLDVFIGFPGSVHDARVLRESPFFPEAAAKCGDGCYLLGDSAYPHLPWLLTPYKDNGQRFPQWKKRFNKCHSQQRVAIENTFGLLKQRFRRLYLVDAKTILQSCKIVLGACVLHNWCNAERDFLAEFVYLPDHEVVGNEDDVDITTPSGCESRRQIIAQHQC